MKTIEKSKKIEKIDEKLDFFATHGWEEVSFHDKEKKCGRGLFRKHH